MARGTGAASATITRSRGGYSDEQSALALCNAVSVRRGHALHDCFPGGNAQRPWSKRGQIAWLLALRLPYGPQLRFWPNGTMEFWTARTGHRHYREIIEVAEQFAVSLGVELERSWPHGPVGHGSVLDDTPVLGFVMPIPEVFARYIADEPEEVSRFFYDFPRQIRTPFGGTIKRKSDMYRRYERGEFGNKLRTWSSVEELADSDYRGTVTLRYKASAGGGGWCAYDVPLAQVAETRAQWVSEGADPKLVVANESAPDERLRVQGDVGASPQGGGLVFRYSTAKMKMRDAMKNSKHAYGAQANELLSEYLSPSSLEDVRELLALYPDAIVEFSAYEQMLGCSPGRNAVIWEVRDY
jgi:hypothetical protein